MKFKKFLKESIWDQELLSYHVQLAEVKAKLEPKRLGKLFLTSKKRKELEAERDRFEKLISALEIKRKAEINRRLAKEKAQRKEKRKHPSIEKVIDGHTHFFQDKKHYEDYMKKYRRRVG
jgi:hypothetical protein